MCSTVRADIGSVVTSNRPNFVALKWRQVAAFVTNRQSIYLQSRFRLAIVEVLMPFTLAHPAAVWPIRRLPFLSVIPLILGSLMPDLAAVVPPGILLPHYWLPNTHMLRGTLIVDLPLGYVLLLWLVAMRTPLTAPLWEPHRSYIRAAFSRMLSSKYWWLIAVPSLIVGSWTHVVWDAFTHENRFVTRHLAILQQPLLPDSGHPMQIYHVLQYLCSIAGLLVIVAWYVYDLRRSGLVGTGRLWRKYTLASLVGGSLLLGAIKAWNEPPEITASFYVTVSVLLNTAMSSFAILYIIAGVIIAWRTDHRSPHS